MSAIQRIARIDPTLHARLERLRPLLYTRIRGSADECGSEGTSAGACARPHVHAASAIRRWDDSTLAIVQDDVRALALLRADGTLAPLALEGESGSPLAAGASESKLTKLDLEAAVVLPDGRLLAFGSGALSAREYIVCVSRPYAVRVIGAHELYRTLRDDTAFSGAGLNLEGALIAQSRLILFQRGNAAPGSSRSFNAIGEMDLDAPGAMALRDSSNSSNPARHP